MLPYFLNYIKTNVFQKLGRLLHDLGRELVNGFVIDSFAQLVVLRGAEEIRGNGNVQGIFVSDALLFGIIAVICKKFESFETDRSQWWLLDLVKK